MTEGYVEVARNRVLNPSFERAVPGSSVARTNLSRNAGLAINAGIFAFGGTGASGMVTSHSPTGGPLPNTGYFEQMWTTQTSDPSGIYLGGIPSYNPVTPGLAYSDSVWVWSSVATVARANVVQRRSDNSAVVETYGPYVSVPANQWVLLTNENFVAQAGAVGYEVRARIAGTAQGGVIPPVGSMLRVSAFVHEAVPKALPFFYGGSPNERGFVFAFTGTANASPSTLQCSLVEVRRNVAPDPGCLNSTILWRTRGGNASNADVTTSYADASWTTSGKVYQILGSATSTSLYAEATPLQAETAVSAGQSWLFRVKLRSDITRSVRARMRLNSGVDVLSDPVSVGATPTELVVLMQVPVGSTATTAGFTVVPADSTAFGAGNVFEAGDALVELAPAVMPFFAGYFTPDADLTPGWTGTPNNSPSTLSGVLVDTVEGGLPPAVMSWLTSGPGQASVRLLPIGAASGWQNARLTDILLAGRTYTAILIARADQAVTLGGALTIEEFGGQVRVLATLTPDLNLSGVRTYRAVFTVPSDVWQTTRVKLRRATQDVSVFYEQLFIVEGDYSGSYFDGDTASTPGVELFSWLGEKHNSMSIREVLAASAASGLELAYYGRRGFTGSLEDRRIAFYGPAGEWVYWAARSGLTPSERYSLSDHKYAAMRAATGASGQLTLTDLITLYYRQTV